MIIDEAIKKIQYVIDDYPKIYSEEVLAALELGIEALKQHRALRRINPISQEPLLPGETEE